MKDLYKTEESCMAFSNEVLEKHFFERIKKNLEVALVYSYCDDQHSDAFLKIISSNCELVGEINNDYLDKVHRIDCVSFDSAKCDFSIHFHDPGLVSMFLFDAQFMFIDDVHKPNSHDTAGCIVYEGYLRDKTHEQILEIFLELFKILHGTTKVTYKEHFVSRICLLS